ncbi:hypothetical protein LSCM1_02882 [Leishmania martiniquensis]|uniref:Uncharacterized protein n=1 Tax=Leishmania martiniquensis TaxID=1580590 RepID=A0A836HLX1_9TRYP|nr:hypothetical protein LSCM1_02882 [Leishmania martiniquensis]
MRRREDVQTAPLHPSQTATARNKDLQPSLHCLSNVRKVPTLVESGGGGGGGGERGVSHTVDSSVTEILADVSVSNAADSNPAPVSPPQEALRSRAEHLSKRLRQTQSQEARQRALLVGEAATQFADIVRRHVAYVDIATSCANLKAAQNARRQAEAQQALKWERQILQDTLCDAILEEETSRKGLEQRQLLERRSLTQLHRAEVQPLQQREAFFRLIHGEEMRRSFVHREEARAVEAMGIPHFISLPCVQAPAGATFGPRGGSRPNVQQSVAELSKLDLMALQRCPFECAAECPFMPQRMRQLGERWAAAVGSEKGAHGTTAAARRHLCNTSHPSAARPSWQVRASTLGITEVGKQRVRNTMMIQHYSATAKFLPTLRL